MYFNEINFIKYGKTKNIGDCYRVFELGREYMEVCDDELDAEISSQYKRTKLKGVKIYKAKAIFQSLKAMDEKCSNQSKILNINIAFPPTKIIIDLAEEVAAYMCDNLAFAAE